MEEATQIFNSPSKIWRTQAQLMKGKPKPKEKMPWTCCEIREACKERDMGILTQISNFLKCGVTDDYPIFKVRVSHLELSFVWDAFEEFLDCFRVGDPNKAIREEHDDCARRIVAYFGPPIIRIRNKWGEPAMVYAVRNKREAMVEVLLKYDCSPSSGEKSLLEIKNSRDETPLYVAVELKHLDIVQILISAGSNPVEPCIRGWTAIHEAAVQDLGS